MATTRVVVDPITRIEGHLRIEAQADAGKITNAWATSTQFRGIEIIMQGRDPRDAWAFTQRICGVCTVVHAVASCRAVEDALDIKIPPNANLIRNLIHGMQFVQDHVMHFYHLHALDWVDVVSALSAKPSETAAIAKSVSPWPNNSETYFAEVQNRLKTFVGSGQLGIFANGYWGHPAYKLPPAVNLLAVAHYLEALDWQRDVIRVHTIFGGKNPHPNFLVGGMASAINLDSRMTINAARLVEIHGMIARAQRFVEQVYYPDLMAIAGFYKEWAGIGGGTGNYLACGEFPDGDVRDIDSLYFPRGIILGKDLTKVWPYDHKQVQEYINSSWYEYSKGDEAGLHPWEGETKAKYTGPKTPWTYLQGEKKYSWMKTPRYEGRAMEVGTARAHAGGVLRGARRRAAHDQGIDGPAGCRSRRPVLHLGTDCGARRGDCVALAAVVALVRCPGRPHQGWRHPDVQWRQVGPGEMAGKGPGLRLPRRAARGARALGADRGPEDLPLSVRRPEYLELLAARCEGGSGALRGCVDG